MDLGESLFKRWLKVRAALQAQLKPPSQHKVTLKQLSHRLEAFGALLLGEIPELKGGTAQEKSDGFFLFPDSCDLLPSSEENTLLYRYRLLFAVKAHTLGLFMPKEYTRAEEQLLYTLLAVPPVTSALEEEFSGAHELRTDLFPAVLQTRFSVNQVKSSFDLLELVAQLHLGRPFSHLPSSLSSIHQELLERCVTTYKLSDIPTITEEVLTLLQRTFARSQGTPYAPLLLWYLPGKALAERIESAALPDLKVKRSPTQTIDLDRTVHLKRQSSSKKQTSPLFHSFEKTESIEEYQGEQGGGEESTNLEEEAESLKELQLGHVIRTMETPQGLLKAELVDEGTSLYVEGSSVVGPEVFHYPEWNFKKKEYREDWCTVYQEMEPLQVGPFGEKAAVLLKKKQREVQEIQASLIRLLSLTTAVNRQLDGAEIDIEALTERHADLAAGHTPPERLYLSTKKALKEVAIFLLFDSSFSTDGWIDGRRILDIEIESLLILASACEGYLDEEVAVAHFNSKTRHQCRFRMLKTFDEPWKRLRHTALGIEPFGYTRIGPAVRHATMLLEKKKAKRKILLLLSDGKPTDYDQYEGKYGILDVQQAVREAKQQRIATIGLAIEQRAKFHLAEMFGSNHFHILPKSSLLPGYMADLFIRALH